MIRYLIIDPTARTVRKFETKDTTAKDAMATAGLKPGAVDFGMVGPAVSIIVGETGLFSDPDKGGYFSLGLSLFHGPAVLFGVGDSGETISLAVAADHNVLSGIRFYDSLSQIEKAIQDGVVDRPQMSVNGEVVWRWPEQGSLGLGG
jgi:hypothetical protein